MTTHSSYSAVLFDLDGTLLDTAPDMIGALNVLRKRAERPPLELDLARDYVSHGSRALVELGFSDHSQSSKQALVEEFLQAYEANICERTQLFEGMLPWLEDFKDRQIPWGIVTNKPEFLTTKLLRELQLDPPPQCVIAGDSLLKRKPHPMPTLHAAALLKRSAGQCIFVGDARADIEAGRTSGMYTIAATYGYILPTERPEDWHAHNEAQSVAQLIETVDALLER